MTDHKRFDAEIKKFVTQLAKVKLDGPAYNQYSFDIPTNALRRRNLVRYLLHIQEYSPNVILVGEAPGYRGSRLSGVPFCSERIIIEDSIFFKNELGFQVEKRVSPMSEMSASVVWKTLHANKFYPLIWASFPFHPHELDNPESNRAPTREEIALGVPFIQSLITLYGIKHVVAVGRVAEKTVSSLGFTPLPVRHPSHGGATLFSEGIKQIAKKLIQ